MEAAIEGFPERIDRLRKVFCQLESKKVFVITNTAKWRDVKQYLTETEKMVRKNLENLLAKEKALDVRMEEAKQAIQEREAQVSEKELASFARIQERQDAEAAIILEEKRKWEESKQALTPDTTKSFGNQSKSAKHTEDKESKPDKDLHEQAVMDVESKPDAGGRDESKIAPHKEAVMPRPELVAFCKDMNFDSLRSYIAEHKKELNAISAELPLALKAASDPAQLVLKALDGYHPLSETTPISKDSTLLPTRRAIVIMLEALSELETHLEKFNISSEIKQSAKEFADLWKSKLTIDGEIGSHVALDAQSFLQLLATFGLASEYDQDELCKLITAISRRRQTPALCRALGLSSKVPDLVGNLVKETKHLEALAFVNAFELSEHFEAVSLLKSYLKETKKTVQNILKSGHNTVAAQKDANQKELTFLRAALKAINEYKLEKKYSPALLEKRVAQLEKAKQDRKRSASNGKAEQTKRPRINNVVTAKEKPFVQGSDRAHYGGMDAVGGYGTAAQLGFDRSAYGAAHVPVFGGGSRSPVLLSSSYSYRPGGLGYGSLDYLNTSSSYGGYGMSYGSGTGAVPLSGIGGAALSYHPYL